MLLGRLLFCLLVFACSDRAAIGAERWTDQSGGVHDGDRAPEGVASESVTIQPNSIDTRPAEPVESGDGPVPGPEERAVQAPESVTVETELEEYVELCRRNRGVECDEEARQMLEGPAPITFPGDPAIFPRPDLHPPAAESPRSRPLRRPGAR